MLNICRKNYGLRQPAAPTNQKAGNAAVTGQAVTLPVTPAHRTAIDSSQNFYNAPDQLVPVDEELATALPRGNHIDQRTLLTELRCQTHEN